ncbi:MAG: magnesium transporter, partial [Spirochaetales bacterium]|nr:magnesium transporter [Spirochaetales bacterium]
MSDYLEILHNSDALDGPALRTFLEEISPQILEEHWGDLDENTSQKIFLALDIEKKAELMSLLQDSKQEAIITYLSAQNTRLLVEEMEPDDLVDLIQNVSKDVRRSVWESLNEELRKETLFLLRFDEDDAAGLMTPRYTAIRKGKTVGETIRFIRRGASEAETIYYIYVVDNLNRLKGVLSIKQLLLASDETLVDEILTDSPVTVREDTDQEETARILDSHNLIAVPVVDAAEKLLGIVTVDDIIAVIREEQTEDVYKMGAMDGVADPYLSTTILGLVKKRIPWLVVLLLLGTVTTNLLHHYESIILGATFLFIFMPVITQTGGNAGGQSSTLMIRGLATGEIHFKDFKRVIWREILVGILLGVATGLVIFLRSYLLPPGIGIAEAAAIGSALIFVVLFATVVGTVAPILIARLGFDPTVMSAP